MYKFSKLLFILLTLMLSSCATGPEQTTQSSLLIIQDGIIEAPEFGLMWQQRQSERFNESREAEEYVKELNLGNFNDWRIPTKEEFHNLFYSLDGSGKSAKKLGLYFDGPIWVKDKAGKTIAGSWDAAQTCCIIRIFRPGDNGRVRAVRP